MRQRTIKLPDGLNDRLEARMAEQDRSANWIIGQALERELSGEPVADLPLGATPSADKSPRGSSSLPVGADRSAASVRAPAPESRAEMFRRMRQK